jgi:hypothetical protein
MPKGQELNRKERKEFAKARKEVGHTTRFFLPLRTFANSLRPLR